MKKKLLLALGGLSALTLTAAQLYKLKSKKMENRYSYELSKDSAYVAVIEYIKYDDLIDYTILIADNEEELDVLIMNKMDEYQLDGYYPELLTGYELINFIYDL